MAVREQFRKGKGKLADIVLLKGNPLDNIEFQSSADNVKAVFWEGKKIK
jgi:imidazolonepropionase-like amidohydrolase